jgi:hypothetical protein
MQSIIQWGTAWRKGEDRSSTHRFAVLASRPGADEDAEALAATGSPHSGQNFALAGSSV